MSEEDPLSGPPLIGPLLRLLDQYWSERADAALRAAGFGDIGSAHAKLLAFVPPQGIRLSELGRLSHTRKQRTAQVVADLEQLGYVERIPDLNDRRARLVLLTPRGLILRRLSATAGRQVERDWAQLTSLQVIETLRICLQELLAELENGEE